VSDLDAASVTIPVPSADGILPKVVRTLDAAGLDVHDVAVRRATLDDVFMTLTGHAAEADAGPDERDAA
jgi:ABC-2 type transport system ATP-binding protein